MSVDFSENNELILGDHADSKEDANISEEKVDFTMTCVSDKNKVVEGPIYDKEDSPDVAIRPIEDDSCYNSESEDVVNQYTIGDIKNKKSEDIIDPKVTINNSKKTLLCKVCGYIPEIQTKYYMRLHQKEHGDLTGIKRTIVKSESVNLNCEVCNKKLKSFSDLKRHMIQHTGERNWQCDVCPRKFGQKYQLKKHIETHSDNREVSYWFCQHCDKRLTSKISRDAHELGHFGEHRFSCEECGKGFNDKTTMWKHKVKLHGCSYEYLCNQCGRGFLELRTLNKHSPICKDIPPKRKNNYNAVLPCPLCDKIFNRRCNLERHLKVHAGVKEFSCEQCGKLFSSKKTVKKHTEKQHKDM